VKISQADGKTILAPSVEDIRIDDAGNLQSIATNDKKVFDNCKSTGSFEKRFVSAIN